MKQLGDIFIEQYHLQCTEQIRYMDLVSEVGALGKELIKGCDYGTSTFEVTKDTMEELGDCLFSLLALCSDLQIDANDALNMVLTKYKEQFDDTGNLACDL